MHPHDGRVISNFILQALRDDPITVFGDGLQTRSFCYVEDMIEGLIRMMNSPDDLTGPINLGNPEEVSILELAKRIIDLTGSGSKIIFKALPSDDPRQRRPLIDLAREKLEWAPKTSLVEGLKKTIAYFEEVLRRGYPG